jgi:2-C-methyl-D-erythritol 4-phosphate cytidylyltransferase
VSGIIVAAGSGERMKGATLKQFLLIMGKPMLAHTVQRFEECESISEIAIVVPPGKQEYCQREIVSKYGLKKVVACVEGGEKRQDSVYKGLVATTGAIVCVHDGVRPLVTGELITECVDSARAGGAAIAAIPVKDTIKRVSEEHVVATLDRREMWKAQTPQVFRREVLERAFAKAREEGYSATDESSLVESLGMRVRIVAGSPENLKVTTREDLSVIMALMEAEG